MTKQKGIALLVGILFVATIIVTIINNPRGPGFVDSGTSSVQLPPSFSLSVFRIDSIAWGFSIYADSTLVLEEKYIPSAAGEIRMESQAEALRCGQVALEKIKAGHDPSPGIREIDSLPPIHP